jgi:hypothetical protein
MHFDAQNFNTPNELLSLEALALLAVLINTPGGRRATKNALLVTAQFLIQLARGDRDGKLGISIENVMVLTGLSKIKVRTALRIARDCDLLVRTHHKRTSRAEHARTGKGWDLDLYRIGRGQIGDEPELPGADRHERGQKMSFNGKTRSFDSEKRRKGYVRNVVDKEKALLAATTADPEKRPALYRFVHAMAELQDLGGPDEDETRELARNAYKPNIKPSRFDQVFEAAWEDGLEEQREMPAAGRGWKPKEGQREEPSREREGSAGRRQRSSDSTTCLCPQAIAYQEEGSPGSKAGCATGRTLPPLHDEDDDLPDLTPPDDLGASYLDGLANLDPLDLDADDLDDRDPADLAWACGFDDDGDMP